MGLSFFVTCEPDFFDAHVTKTQVGQLYPISIALTLSTPGIFLVQTFHSKSPPICVDRGRIVIDLVCGINPAMTRAVGFQFHNDYSLR